MYYTWTENRTENIFTWDRQKTSYWYIQNWFMLFKYFSFTPSVTKVWLDYCRETVWYIPKFIILMLKPKLYKVFKTCICGDPSPTQPTKCLSGLCVCVCVTYSAVCSVCYLQAEIRCKLQLRQAHSVTVNRL